MPYGVMAPPTRLAKRRARACTEWVNGSVSNGLLLALLICRNLASPSVTVTGVSLMSDIGFIVLVIAVFALIGLIARGVNRL